MTKTQAILFLGFMLGRVGSGYHPDTPISDYTGGFSQDEVDSLQIKHDLMLETLGHDKVCALALEYLGVS